MPSILAKRQKCGKPTCRCSEGYLHGPYLWLVTYHSSTSSDRRAGKYSWLYLGRYPEKAWDKLRAIDPRFDEKFKFSTLVKKLKNVQDRDDFTLEPSVLLTIPEI